MAMDLTEGNILKTILKTSIPLIIAFLMQSIFNLVDAFFVGQISPEALAAVSISFPIVFLIISLGTGIGAGANSVVARFIGAGDYRKADNAAEHAILSAFVISVVLTVVGILSSPFLFSLMGAEGEVRTLAVDYLNVILSFSAFMLVGMVANNILRAEGDMVTPMKIMGFSAVLNMFLDPLFIFQFNMGVSGAAIATILSRATGMVLLFRHILSGKSQVRLRPKDFTFNSDYIKRIFAVGVPSSLSNISVSIGMFFMTFLIGSYGTGALAAYGIGFRLDSLAVLPGLGVSFAVISIVGQNIGAGKKARARDVTIKAGFMASAMMSFVGALFYIFAPWIVSVFNSSADVVENGVLFLRIIPFSYTFLGLELCMANAFIGSGKAILSFFINALRAIFLSVPLAYLLSGTMGLSGIWWGMVLGGLMGFFVTLLLFFRGGWDNTKA